MNKLNRALKSFVEGVCTMFEDILTPVLSVFVKLMEVILFIMITALLFGGIGMLLVYLLFGFPGALLFGGLSTVILILGNLLLKHKQERDHEDEEELLFGKRLTTKDEDGSYTMHPEDLQESIEKLGSIEDLLESRRLHIE